MFKQITEDAKGLRFGQGPWGEVFDTVLTAVLVGIPMYLAGHAAASDWNPTFNFIMAALVTAIMGVGAFVGWHTTFMSGQIDQIKKDTKRMLTQMRTGHGFKS